VCVISAIVQLHIKCVDSYLVTMSVSYNSCWIHVHVHHVRIARFPLFDCFGVITVVLYNFIRPRNDL